MAEVQRWGALVGACLKDSDTEWERLALAVQKILQNRARVVDDWSLWRNDHERLTSVSVANAGPIRLRHEQANRHEWARRKAGKALPAVDFHRVLGVHFQTSGPIVREDRATRDPIGREAGVPLRWPFANGWLHLHEKQDCRWRVQRQWRWLLKKLSAHLFFAKN